MEQAPARPSEAVPIELVVGLGNPGPRYADTRHNAGFWFVDALACRAGATFRSNARFSGELAEGAIGGRRIRLLKPSTYVNRSGSAVGAAARFYRIEPEAILVVHDEIDLPPGELRLKVGGGHAGHNGLRDIIAHLGTNRFVRLRIGVGHPGQRDEVVGHVLHRASSDDRRDIEAAMARGLDEIEAIVRGEHARSMNALNRRTAPPAPEPEPQAPEQ